MTHGLQTADPAGPWAAQRRAPRIGVELPVRCKVGLIRSTVMLKDMTMHGARIEGIGLQREGESITLLLPALPAVTAFVAWSQPMASGLEFLHPLPEHAFAELVRDYAINRTPPGPFTPTGGAQHSPQRRAA